MPGKLYIVSTPIGNLKDISTRVVQALSECDFVLAEDTRVTVKLMSHLGLSKKLVSCHDFNEEERAAALSSTSGANQTVALVSDAGTPLVSDPGFTIVRKAIELGMPVIPIAGPSAFLLALIGSGLPCDRFGFEGFLPDKQGAARKRLTELARDSRTLVFYVSPHKITTTLNMVAEYFGSSRPACLARELTKLHEEFVRGSLTEIIEKLKDWQPRGEIVLVVGGNSDTETTPVADSDIIEAIKSEIESGKRMSDVASAVAERFSLKKSDVYKLALENFAEPKDEDDS
jgi:16S rRNA (cytidine1402-2'-O)-methyltransferase